VVIIVGLTLTVSLANRSANNLPSLILAVIVRLFFLAPAGYPWYSIWFFALVPFVPNPGIILLSITLPLYYLRFPFAVYGYDDLFNYVIAPVEFGLPLAIIAFSYWRSRKAIT